MAFLKVPNQSFRWLGAELVVVVLGILIAFQIEEWRTEVSDREQEQVLLAGILDDLELDLVNLRNYRDRVDSAGRAAVRLRELLESGKPRDARQVLILWVDARAFWSWRRTSPTYTGWVQSARPDLVSNPALRQELYLYHDILLQDLDEKPSTFKGRDRSS